MLLPDAVRVLHSFVAIWFLWCDAKCPPPSLHTSCNTTPVAGEPAQHTSLPASSSHRKLLFHPRRTLLPLLCTDSLVPVPTNAAAAFPSSASCARRNASSVHRKSLLCRSAGVSARRLLPPASNSHCACIFRWRPPVTLPNVAFLPQHWTKPPSSLCKVAPSAGRWTPPLPHAGDLPSLPPSPLNSNGSPIFVSRAPSVRRGGEPSVVRAHARRSQGTDFSNWLMA